MSLKDGIWTTFRGQKIPLAELETDHLVNILGLLERSAEKRLEATGLRADDPANIAKLYPYYADLQTELRKRLAIDVGERQHRKVEAFHQRQFERGLNARLLVCPSCGSDPDVDCICKGKP